MNPEGRVPYRDGELCCEGESARFLARHRALPSLDPDDFLAIASAGAYALVIASSYNARPRAAEGLVDGHRFTIVRHRETVEGLVAGETTV